MTTADCIFCKIGRGDLSPPMLYDDGVVFAIRDIHPLAPTHLLLIPHEHVDTLTEASGRQMEAAARCLRVAPQVAQQVGLARDGYRLVVNQGADGGQVVGHFHVHLLGGRKLGSFS